MKDVERIFGLFNWSRMFLNNFASKAEPIANLLKYRNRRGIRISNFWTKEVEQAKNDLIEEILEKSIWQLLINQGNYM